jgi:hypothetical protein
METILTLIAEMNIGFPGLKKIRRTGINVEEEKFWLRNAY